MKSKLLIFHVILFLAPLSLSAQQFSLQQFRAAEGLRTDMIKSVAQDSLGFVWIGTDDGIVQYDGVAFKHFPKAAKSNFFKDFLYTQDHRLLALHDLGVLEIKNTIDTVIFSLLLDGERTLTEGKLWYPKSIYEDEKGGIWFGEPQSVSRYYQSKLQRFPFGKEDNSISFVRSFNFLQLYDGRLLISSYPGNFYAYDFQKNKIDTLEVVGNKVADISVLYPFNNEILVGSVNNFNRMHIEDNKVFMERIYDDFSVSDLQQIGDNRLIATTFTNAAFEIQLVGNKYIKHQIKGAEASMNQVYMGFDSTLWLSTEKGIITMEEFVFKSIDIGIPNIFIEDIEIDYPSGKAYAIIKDDIWEIDLMTLVPRQVFKQKNGYFLSLEIIKNRLWVANEFEVWEIENGEVVHKIDFSEYGRFIHEMQTDRNNILWFSQEAAIGTKSLNPETYELKIYGKEAGIDYVVTAVTDSPKGIYFVTENAENYLYFKPHNSDTFQNISQRFPEEYKEGLRITDIEVQSDTVIWLATQYGIFKHTPNAVNQLKFNENFHNVITNDIEIQGNNLWFGNTFGLFRYNLLTNEYAHFTENSGLPINTVTESEYLVNTNQIWVGTPSGIAIANIDNNINRYVSPPLILALNSNEAKVKINSSEKIAIESNSFLEITFSNLSFPANTIEYSYRLKELDSLWSAPKGLTVAKFSGLSSGKYTFEVKARRLSGQRWSTPTALKFTVNPPFYATAFFYFWVMLTVLLLIAITRGITQYFMRKQQLLLETQVQERTAELKQIKNKLEINNEQLEQRVGERTKELDRMNVALTISNQELLAQREVLKKALKNLQETQQKLVHSEKMASLGLLSAGVAHEINNPLNFIQGGIIGLDSYFKKNYQDPPTQVLRMIEIVKEGVSRASIIVKSLNHFSRQGGSENENCDIHGIIDNCFVMLYNKTKHKIEITREYEAKTFIIVGNEGKFHQVFLNILTNAVQAIPEKGCIYVGTNIVKDTIEILIKDSGTGIKKEDLPKIKDPFFTTKEPGKGTGLGLSITQNILEEYNGTIDFDSVIGKGTTVRISLPINNEAV